jgi:hypothetical protein
VIAGRLEGTPTREMLSIRQLKGIGLIAQHDNKNPGSLKMCLLQDSSRDFERPCCHIPFLKKIAFRHRYFAYICSVI